jgi:hypothetical protein
VAAVLGVVNTMGSVGQPPAVLGGMIGSAWSAPSSASCWPTPSSEPLAGLLEQKIDEDGKELQCIKTTLLASMQGYAPQVAIEFGRKVLYSTERPTFSELEGHVKGKKVIPSVARWRSPQGRRRRTASRLLAAADRSLRASWGAVMAGDAKKLQPIIIKRVKKGGPRAIMAAPGRSPTPTS